MAIRYGTVLRWFLQRIKTALLKSYWAIPERQIETSVVLANPPLSEQCTAYCETH
jgi:hypothetical protein